MATLKDIAVLAGVSQGTVSNVLNGRGNVSSEKIRLVEAAASQLNYTVNERAKFLRKGYSNIIAIVLPNTSSPSYENIYVSFKRQVELEGYSVSLYLSDDIPSRERQIINQLKSDMVTAAVILSCLPQGYMAYCNAGFSPYELLFLEREQTESCNFIGFNYKEAGRAMGAKAAKYTKKIILATAETDFSPEKDFLSAFCDQLTDRQNTNLQYLYIDPAKQQHRAINLLSQMDDNDIFFTTDISFAQITYNICKNFFSEKQLGAIYTISPLITLPDYTFHRYELNYRLLGNRAAQQIIRQLENRPEKSSHSVLENTGFRSWNGIYFKKSDPITLNLLMLNGPEVFAVQSLSRIYTQQSGVTVNISSYSYDETYEILSSSNVAAYDILRIDITFLSWFAQKLLVPLRNLDPNISELLPTFLDGVAERYSTIANELYALPFSPSVQLLYYRRDLFENTALKRIYKETYHANLVPPTTFTDFNRIAEFFTKRVNPDSPTEFGASLTLRSIGTSGSEFMARFLETHENLYDNDHKVRLSSKAGKDALERLIFLKGLSPDIPDCWWTNTAESFASGQTAMTILYSNYAADFFKTDTSMFNKIGYALVPGQNPVLGGASLGISKYSRHQMEALDLMRWLCSETVSSACTYLGGSSPCKKTYENYEILDSYPWLDLAQRSFSLAHGYRQPANDIRPFPERKFLNIIGMAVKNAFNGVQTPAEALSWAQKEYDTTIECRK